MHWGLLLFLPLLGPMFQIPSAKGTGALCKLSPSQLYRGLDVAVEEMGEDPPFGKSGVGVCAYGCVREGVRERKRTCMQKPSNCKNATCFLLAPEGVLLFHVNLAHAGSHLQFVLFVLFRNQEVFFCVFLFWKSHAA